MIHTCLMVWGIETAHPVLQSDPFMIPRCVTTSSTIYDMLIVLLKYIYDCCLHACACRAAWCMRTR